jgi:P4 family phage/plasmid primase-like protien
MDTQAETPRSVKFKGIPEALKAPPQWVLWKEIERDGDPTKMPLQPNGNPASSTDSTTWSDFETVRSAFESGGFAGIGFVFAEGPFVGVDLDDCFEEGALTGGALDVVDRLDSYTEVSPSGTGLHVICRGFLTDMGNRTGDVDGMKELEIYEDGRYFTFTGEHLEGTPGTPEQRAQEVYSLCKDLFGAAEKNQGDSSNGTAESLSNLDDRELIEKAKGADNGAKFTRLWDGDTSGYKSHSEAQQALANLLAFWTGGDKDRMERLFEKSGMCRGDDDVRKFSNHDANTALDGKTEFYDPSGKPSSSSSPGEANTAKSDPDTEDPGFSVSEFREALDGLQDKEAEHEATKLLNEVATLDRSEIARCRDILEEHGARARRLRSFESDAKTIRKELEEESSAGPDGPQDLKHGELTAWIAEQVLAENAFALDGSGALYYYAGGRYVDGGEEYLNKQIKSILDAEDMTREFTRYRCEEVRHRIATDAPSLWDEPPRDRINLKNGILNLDTLELEPHGPGKWLSTRQIPIAFDPDAEGDAWETVLNQWFPEDAGAEVAYEWIASLITPAFGRRKATYLYGGKSKGKSTLLRNLVDGVFGGQGVRHMTPQELDGDPFAKADLFDATLNVCADLPAAPMEGTSVFKQITGGDRMSAQRKYKDRFSFTPHCELVFSGNVPIRAPDAGEPFWDRWRVIPFRGVSFDPGSEDHIPEEELDARLQDPEELSALLNELLKAIPKVRREGVTETDSMAGALESIRRHPTNDLPTRGAPTGSAPPSSQHSGDGTARVPEEDTALSAQDERRGDQNEKHEGVSNPNSGNTPSTDGGEGYSQNFEKEEGSDTRGTCPRNDAFQSFERGDPVETPDGTGTVKELRPVDSPNVPPKVLVSLDHGPSKRYSPGSLTRQDEAPF